MPLEEPEEEDAPDAPEDDEPPLEPPLLDAAELAEAAEDADEVDAPELPEDNDIPDDDDDDDDDDEEDCEPSSPLPVSRLGHAIRTTAAINQPAAKYRVTRRLPKLRWQDSSPRPCPCVMPWASHAGKAEVEFRCNGAGQKPPPVL